MENESKTQFAKPVTLQSVMLLILTQTKDPRKIRGVFCKPEQRWTSGEKILAKNYIHRACKESCPDLQVLADELLSKDYKPINQDIYCALLEKAQMKAASL
jgi:hypothetical protein